MPLPTSLFDYHLPPEAIAQHPVDKRDHSRLLVVHRDTKQVEHRFFYELPEILTEKFIFFRNTAKVIKARMWLKRASGAEIEILLLRPSTYGWSWWCLVRGLKKITVGEILLHEGKPVCALKEKSPTGEALLEFGQDPLALSRTAGVLPLPPYIARAPHDKNEALDDVRYQTVYADREVAAAAPTAGLHFTEELIEKLKGQGHGFVDVTLHVGLDTFRPITTETVEEHKIHTETYEVSEAAAAALKEKTFKLAVGTTSLRTLEDFYRKGQRERVAEASLFIYPPQVVQSVDALLTNFHLPKSTLMCLVSAFLTPGSLAGIAWLKNLYAEALKKGYRFYSYGDAMLIL